jgi:hypothetical protein
MSFALQILRFDVFLKLFNKGETMSNIAGFSMFHRQLPSPNFTLLHEIFRQEMHPQSPPASAQTSTGPSVLPQI